MDDLIARISDDLVARITGPMKFRLVLQPAMAIFPGDPRWIEGRLGGQAAVLLGHLHRRRGTPGDAEGRLEVGRKGVCLGGRARCGLPDHRAAAGLPRRGRAGRDHSSHRALPADPRTCQSNRAASPQCRKATIGRGLDSSSNQIPKVLAVVQEKEGAQVAFMTGAPFSPLSPATDPPRNDSVMSMQADSAPEPIM